MTYLPFILLFLSLAGIAIMIGRKLVLVRNGQVVKFPHPHFHPHPLAPDLQKVKNLTFVGIRKLGYITIFITLKGYIKSSNFLKTKSKMLMEELKERLKKDTGINTEDTAAKREVSKYLKIISEYRQKIKKIKHRIKQEEGIK